MANWSELPSEILYSISLKIDNPFDLIHFRSICSHWRTSSLPKFQHMPSLRCPLPLDSGGYGDDCHILSSRVYLIKSTTNESPQHWLFKLNVKENGEVVLDRMFQRKFFGYRCEYPSLRIDLRNCHVVELAQEHMACYSEWLEDFRCVLKGRESSIAFMDLGTKQNEFMILGKLRIQGMIGMYRSVDERWTELWTELQISPENYIAGIISFKGKFYAIDFTGKTIVVDQSLEINTFQRSRGCDKTRRRWLVKSGDKLLLVEMCTALKYDNKPNYLANEVWFEISELDEENNDWVQVKDLDGRVLFLERYYFFSCLATEIPGFRPNSIIFFDDGFCSVLVFEFDEQRVKCLYDIPEYIDLFPTPPVEYGDHI